MKISQHRRLTSVVLWVPVSAIVAALFLVPSGTDAAARKAVDLDVTPQHVYAPGATTGGQMLTFSGDMGNGEQRIYLERRGNPNAKWARVPDPRPGPGQGQDFTTKTDGDGTFSFDFPAPAMNACFFRVVSGSAETEAHQFNSVHQDVEITGPATATAGVPYQVTGDTVLRALDNRPIFDGRGAALQRRTDAGEWETVTSAAVGGDGKLAFPDVTTATPGEQVYRIRLDDWTLDEDRIGWFPSHPFTVTVNP